MITISMMTTLMLTGLFWGAECLFFPLFIRAQWPEKCVKSFVLKLISASIFVAYGLFLYYTVYTHTGVVSKFAYYIVSGLIGGWLGDIFLHLTAVIPVKKKAIDAVCFVLGLVAFLVGHIFYVLAFIEGLKLAGVESIPVYTWIIVAALVVVEVIIAIASPVKLGIAAVPCGLYAVTISTMLAMAITLAINFFGKSPFTSLLLIIGSVLFVISDGTLVFNMFGGEKFAKSYKLKVVNLVTYFLAQMFLASLILFVRMR